MNRNISREFYSFTELNGRTKEDNTEMMFEKFS